MKKKESMALTGVASDGNGHGGEVDEGEQVGAWWLSTATFFGDIWYPVMPVSESISPAPPIRGKLNDRGSGSETADAADAPSNFFTTKATPTHRTMCVESSSCLDLVEIRADPDRQERDPQSSTVSWNIP